MKHLLIAALLWSSLEAPRRIMLGLGMILDDPEGPVTSDSAGLGGACCSTTGYDLTLPGCFAMPANLDVMASLGDARCKEKQERLGTPAKLAESCNPAKVVMSASKPVGLTASLWL